MYRRKTPNRKRKQMRPPFDLSEYCAGYQYVVGIDEAGWGPIAGPMHVAAVCLGVNDFIHKSVKDSKKMSAKRRETAYEWIRGESDFYLWHKAPASTFNKRGAGSARTESFMHLLKQLERLQTKLDGPMLVVIDGNYAPKSAAKLNLDIRTLVKADSKCPAVSAASIVAKQERDSEMLEWHNIYPEYQWDSNKGYATKEHLSALDRFGACEIHRTNTKVVRNAGEYRFDLKEAAE